ncbi:ephexin-1 isoform X2 [Bombina bombina]|uniref:ephexin-1 isoform X2 n=1 Tax=Bombina bombina TaxID=8345 RepID=UPI00235AF559|nr:ephexin-1 isoform X2 [Bombina bombina]
MSRFTREPEPRDSRMGRDTKTGSQVSGTRPLIIFEEEEGEDDNSIMDGFENQPRAIPIRRNSRFYRSMRVRNKHRRDRLSSREGMEIQSQNSGFQGNGDHRNVYQGVTPSETEGRSEFPPSEVAGSSNENRRSPSECTMSNPEAQPAVYPLTVDSWKTLMEQIELLYQEYRDKTTQHEIEARRLQDNYVQPPSSPQESQTPEQGSPPPAELRRPNPSLSRLQSSCSGFNLWQDLPDIRSSGVLNLLQPEEIKLQEAMFELVTSEASYYKSLRLLVSHFMESESLRATIHQSEMHFIFSNVLEVLATSERFLLDLEQRLEENIVISDICDIVHKHATNHFGVYVTYVCNQTYQERAYRKLLQERTEFRDVIAQLETHPMCRGLPFSSFLILPFQRITRLKLLVQNILTKVEEGSEKEASAMQAHRELEKLVHACNDGVRKMSRTEQLISIEKTLEFKIKSVPIISHSRWLLKQGELQQMSGPRTSRTLRTKKLFRSVYLFLFNDLLLLCKRLTGDRYQVFDVAARGLLRVEELEDQGQTLANVFILKLLENAHDREFTYMLKASSQSEMKRWMTSLVPNRRTKFVSITSRYLDCPQVQCVHPYISQEPDELSLDLADILNVLDKTDDGWIFGERLHDQEKGWFPSTVVEEILNPDVRTQNLKECLRVHKTDDGSQNKDRRKMGSRTR